MHTLRRLTAIGAILSIVGLSACSAQEPIESERSEKARTIIEDAIGGADFGAVRLVTESFNNGFLNSATVCNGREVTLYEAATAETLTRVLAALATQSWCSDDATKITFTNHDTVITGENLFFDLPPRDYANIADAVFTEWPSDVYLSASPENSAHFISRLSAASPQLQTLANTITAMTKVTVGSAAEGQAPVRVQLIANTGNDGITTAHASSLIYDPSLHDIATSLASGLAELSADHDAKKSAWRAQLDLTADGVSGNIMLPVQSISAASTGSNDSERSKWGGFVTNLSGAPQGIAPRPNWHPVWSEPSDEALAAAGQVHSLIQQLSLQDSVEVVLVGDDYLTPLAAGHFDPAVASAQGGLASSHPDRQG